MRLISWNVNGIRAITKKGFLDWLNADKADVVCLQETKALPEQATDEVREPKGYSSHWNSAEKKGYSGVATFTKTEPASVVKGFGIEEFDTEGRSLMLEFEEFFLFNIYFPNGKASEERLRYKLSFYDAFLEMAESLRTSGKGVVVCGDVNTAHKPIDLSRPRENEGVSGFLPIERKWIDKLIKMGYVDSFRHFNKDSYNYTWWDYVTRARERNVGWRIDYFFVSAELLPRLKDAFILSDIMGSDHCPIGIELDAK
ncbi:MAG: exodeoxyribonuclease III [Candidatus Proteinoplasmatales archaeon SG8-5]|nr:MAG: exodeoxyribonuclease III [Candidatus Proteinoplasmatales archaeon SG8-5]